MRYISLIIKTLALCFTLIACSCTDPIEVVENIEISIKNPTVASAYGQQFVNVKCNGSSTLRLLSDGGAPEWASLNLTSGEGNKSNVILSYQANMSEQDRELKIVLESGNKKAECSLSQAASGKRPEEDNDSDTSPDGSTDLAKADWMELPAMNNADLGYYTHNFHMNGKTYRNYSFAWSQKDRIALWVAYPLSKLYTSGSAGRTDKWALDPLLGENSSAPFGGYAGAYARGHQLPSADRQCCYDANIQTFYGTNIVPQLNEHNEKIWADLEAKVRGYANTSDTTYVVTGVIVSTNSKKEKDSSKMDVTVPDAFFKAILKYSKASTLGTWNAAGFYLEHKGYSGSISKEHSMSIDKLEEITGIDFFVNLPAKIGESQATKIEAAEPANSAVWW